MDEKQVLENWKRQNEECSQDELYDAQNAYLESLEETIELLKQVIFDAYGEVTNGQYVDRWTRTAKRLEDALEQYGEPEHDGDDPYGCRNG